MVYCLVIGQACSHELIPCTFLHHRHSVRSMGIVMPSDTVIRLVIGTHGRDKYDVMLVHMAGITLSGM